MAGRATCPVIKAPLWHVREPSSQGAAPASRAGARQRPPAAGSALGLPRSVCGSCTGSRGGLGGLENPAPSPAWTWLWAAPGQGGRAGSAVDSESGPGVSAPVTRCRLQPGSRKTSLNSSFLSCDVNPSGFMCSTHLGHFASPPWDSRAKRKLAQTGSLRCICATSTEVLCLQTRSHLSSTSIRETVTG